MTEYTCSDHWPHTKRLSQVEVECPSESGTHTISWDIGLCMYNSLPVYEAAILGYNTAPPGNRLLTSQDDDDHNDTSMSSLPQIHCLHQVQK